jgi:hypothetical protein
MLDAGDFADHLGDFIAIQYFTLLKDAGKGV